MPHRAAPAQGGGGTGGGRIGGASQPPRPPALSQPAAAPGRTAPPTAHRSARRLTPRAADPKAACRLAPIPVTPSAFSVRGSQTQIKYYAENNTVGLALVGIAGPTLTSLYPTFYGMYSIQMQINELVGINSAFYVSSSAGGPACRGRPAAAAAGPAQRGCGCGCGCGC
jgi:hypothetical protein